MEKFEGYSELERELKTYGILYENSSSKKTFAFAITKARALKKMEIKWKEGLCFEFD